MRVMPIDDFLELNEDSGNSASSDRTYDWAKLIREGRAARLAADGGAWRIGALAAMVERRYASGALKRFADEIGESLASVRRFRWVAGIYDERTRARFTGLSFSHFQAVAALPDRLTWLERAQRGRWSVDRLATTARASSKTPVAKHVAMSAPIASATKRIVALNKVDERTLARAARAGLADAVEELMTELERLRARLQRAQKRSMRIAH
jgi:hypothetical protein